MVTQAKESALVVALRVREAYRRRTGAEPVEWRVSPGGWRAIRHADEVASRESLDPAAITRGNPTRLWGTPVFITHAAGDVPEPHAAEHAPT